MMDRQHQYDLQQERFAEQQRHDDAFWRHAEPGNLAPLIPYTVRFRTGEQVETYIVLHAGEPEEAMEAEYERQCSEAWVAGRNLPSAPEWASVFRDGVEVLVAHRLTVVAKKGGKQWGQRINSEEAA